MCGITLDYSRALIKTTDVKVGIRGYLAIASLSPRQVEVHVGLSDVEMCIDIVDLR